MIGANWLSRSVSTNRSDKQLQSYVVPKGNKHTHTRRIYNKRFLQCEPLTFKYIDFENLVSTTKEC